ncbi:MAG: SDR family oxidoreductase [Clostridiaceae bacterium]
MNADSLLISRGNLEKEQLKGKVVLITGAGGGIGYEAARSLTWLGANVIIAEIDKVKGKKAEEELNKEFGEKGPIFIHTNIGNERSVKRLVKKAYNTFGKIDILINNATITPMGSVHEVGINNWDLSYSVNLRGPVLLVSEVLPDMIKRNSGTIVLVPSSGAAPYMGAYEVFKTSQVELANTLAAELEHTEVITYSIGPGIVKTDTAQKAIEKIAPLYGKSVEEFYKMSENVLLTAEEAGAGFAASVVLARQYRGLEIGSIQALMDAGIPMTEKKKSDNLNLSEEEKNNIEHLFKDIKRTFVEQIDGWSTRPIFERQWLMRDFKKLMGASPEYFLDILRGFESALINNKVSSDTLDKLPLEKIASYYIHLIELLKDYEKDKNKVKEYTDIMNGWIEIIERLKILIKEM